MLNWPHIGESNHIDASISHMMCQNFNNSSCKMKCKNIVQKGLWHNHYWESHEWEYTKGIETSTMI